jgi:hypothetical protein
MQGGQLVVQGEDLERASSSSTGHAVEQTMVLQMRKTMLSGRR